MKIFIPILALMIFFSCSSEKRDRKNEITGKWSNLTLDITIKNSTSDSMIVAKEGEWEKVLGFKPIITQFSEDSSFKSEYYTLDNQLFHTSMGKWWIRNDSLVMQTENDISAFHFVKEGNRIKFRGILDWDQDGQMDDIYEGTQLQMQY
jgi:hypothetical protein